MSHEPSTGADLWRDIVAVRLTTMIALCLALIVLDLSRSAVVWGTLLVVAILIPVLIGLLRGAHLLVRSSPWRTRWCSVSWHSSNPACSHSSRA